MLAGSVLGSLFGGPIGSIIGAVLGHQAEKFIRGGGESIARKSGRMAGGGSYASLSERRRTMIFCASAAAMLAKMAKADGHVSRIEIARVEEAFARLGFRASAREYAVGVFRKAKDDGHTIYEYAREFAGVVESVEVRELFYELLWDVACADGGVSSEELAILQRMPSELSIRSDWYAYFYNVRIGGSSREREPVDELAEAYRLLGASASESDDEVKRKYRELAKKNHPDALRAQGLPEAMVGKATERMGRINDAWAKIRAARRI